MSEDMSDDMSENMTRMSEGLSVLWESVRRHVERMSEDMACFVVLLLLLQVILVAFVSVSPATRVRSNSWRSLVLSFSLVWLTRSHGPQGSFGKKKNVRSYGRKNVWRIPQKMSEHISDARKNVLEDMQVHNQKKCQKICQFARRCVRRSLRIWRIDRKECQKICHKSSTRYVRTNARRYVRKNVRRHVKKECLYRKECQKISRKECQKICQDVTLGSDIMICVFAWAVAPLASCPWAVSVERPNFVETCYPFQILARCIFFKKFILKTLQNHFFGLWCRILLRKHRNVKLHQVNQCLFGVVAVKPTGLLAVNKLTFKRDLHSKADFNAEGPVSEIIRVDQYGKFKTACLKEYRKASPWDWSAAWWPSFM